MGDVVYAKFKHRGLKTPSLYAITASASGSNKEFGLIRKIGKRFTIDLECKDLAGRQTVKIAAGLGYP